MANLICELEGVRGRILKLYDTKIIITTKKTIGLSNVENKDSKTIRSEITKENVTHALGYTPISTENIGVPNGIPTLDKEGRIPSSQLPEYTPEKSLEDAKEYTRTYLTEVMNGGGDLNSWKAVTNAINENADDIQTLYNTTRLKVNTVPGKGLSTNDLTNELKEKYDEKNSIFCAKHGLNPTAKGV